MRAVRGPASHSARALFISWVGRVCFAKFSQFPVPNSQFPIPGSARTRSTSQPTYVNGPLCRQRAAEFRPWSFSRSGRLAVLDEERQDRTTMTDGIIHVSRCNSRPPSPGQVTLGSVGPAGNPRTDKDGCLHRPRDQSTRENRCFGDMGHDYTLRCIPRSTTVQQSQPS